MTSPIGYGLNDGRCILTTNGGRMDRQACEKIHDQRFSHNALAASAIAR
jgi:hypothetical protein